MGSERLTPHAHECLVRFGAWPPFQKAAAELAFSLGVVVSEPTARRYAQAAGEAYVDWQTAEAEWEQGFIDFHCPQAVRILDFPHAAERVSAIGQTLWGPESEATHTWLGAQLHSLKHGGPDELLAELGGLSAQHPQVEVLSANLAYLEKRAAHMHYPDYQAQGLPIGSGAMESGNKVVVEARLKGAGMHWAPHHVNPMLALRNILCSDRWEHAWPQIEAGLRQAERLRKKERRARRCAPVASTQPASTMVSLPEVDRPLLPEANLPALTPPAEQAETQSAPKSRCPAPNHPWRRSPIGRAKYWPSNHFSKN